MKQRKSSLCLPCPVEQFCARSAVFGFLLSLWCAVKAELSAEHSCADIVIKSTTACVSSSHSPLICQPCSDGRLCKYMQNRWIRPLHTLPPNFRLFHTLQDSPPRGALDIYTNICIYTHPNSFTSQVSHFPIPEMI